MAYSLIKTITESDSKLTVTGSPSTVELRIYSQEDNSANNSDVRFEVWERNDDSYASWDYEIPSSMYIDGSHFSENVSFTEASQGTWKKMWENTKDNISHNSDGTKSIAISLTMDTGMGAVGDITLTSYTITLPTIPRASILSTVSSFNIEDGVTISYTVYASFTEKLDIYLGTTPIKENFVLESGTKVEFTDDEILNLYKLIPDLTAALSFQLKTYSGSAQIGSTSTKTATGAISGLLRKGVDGVMKRCVIYKEVGGSVKKCIPYIGIGGVGKRGIY